MSGRQQIIPGSSTDYDWSHIISFLCTPQLSSQRRGSCGAPNPSVLRAGRTALSLPGCRWVEPRTGRPCLWAAAPASPPYCARSRSQNTQRDLGKRQHQTFVTAGTQIQYGHAVLRWLVSAIMWVYKGLVTVKCWWLSFSNLHGQNQCVCVIKTDFCNSSDVSIFKHTFLVYPRVNMLLTLNSAC